MVCAWARWNGSGTSRTTRPPPPFPSPTQALAEKLFTLEAKRSDSGPLALLPPAAGKKNGPDAAAWRLPRRMLPPEPKEETKWEKFAKAKGIVKKQSRSKMVWDETAQQWRPRFGYQRTGENEGDGGAEDAIVEVGRSVGSSPSSSSSSVCQSAPWPWHVTDQTAQQTVR